jgi:hypothetical protein
MCLWRAPEKHIAGAALDRADYSLYHGMPGEWIINWTVIGDKLSF